MTFGADLDQEDKTMIYTYIFLGAFFLMFIVGLLYEIQRPSLNKVMKRNNSLYTGKFNNFQDRIRVFKAYFFANQLSKKEKKTLFITIVMNLVIYFSLVILLVILFINPNILEGINHFFRNVP